MGDTVNKMTCKMEETDPWFEDKIVQLDALESQLKKLYTLTEALAFSRREMAIATGQFAGSNFFFCEFYFQKKHFLYVLFSLFSFSFHFGNN